ncbi:MAG: transcription antitermination factor NusB [Actinomycetota bacterium]
MKERRLARRIALDVLYDSEIRSRLPTESLEERRRVGWSLPEGDEGEEGEALVEPSQETAAYAARLVKGIQERSAAIDSLIVEYVDRWAIQRMPVIDRNLLRIGVFELLWEKDIPVAVVINEAVELAKALSTDDSGRFINGVLGRVAREEEEN